MFPTVWFLRKTLLHTLLHAPLGKRVDLNVKKKNELKCA